MGASGALSTVEWERERVALMRLMWRVIGKIRKRPLRDHLIGGVMVKLADIRDRDRALLQAIEIQNKVIGGGIQDAYKRELPELVAEMKRLNAAAQRRQGRLSREPGVQ